METEETTERCSELWFEDGSVVLQAQSTLFRVYRGILAEHSTIFNDMFAVPQPGQIDVIDGCPSVVLQDSASDMTYFLKVMLKPGYYEQTYATDFQLLSATLRLSTKYNAAFLRHRIIADLSCLYPTTLEEWDKRRSHVLFPMFSGRGYLAVQLSRTGESQVLLPAAMYACCGFATLSVFDGFKQPDGTRADELTWTEKRACILGRERIMAECRRASNTLKFSALCDACEFPDRCAIANAQWNPLLDIRRKLTSTVFYYLSDLESQEGVCFPCFDKARAHVREARKKIWDNLPGYFDMPSWDVLRESSSDN